MQLVGRPGVQRYSRAACLRRCHVRCVEKESAGGKAQRLRQRRWQLGDSYDTRQSSHVQGDDDLPRLNSMQLRRSQSGAQAARLADNLIQAPLEPRGVVANLLDKLRVCTSLAKSTYAHLGTGVALSPTHCTLAVTTKQLWIISVNFCHPADKIT